MSRGLSEPVIRLDDCSVFANMAAAAREIGASTSSIKRAIDGNRDCKGWHFAILPEKLRGFGVSELTVKLWTANELLRRSMNQVKGGQENENEKI